MGLSLFGVLILRRAIWVIIMEQGKLYPFVPAAHSRPSGHVHLRLIWGSVMHRGVFLPASFTQNRGKLMQCELP